MPGEKILNEQQYDVILSIIDEIMDAKPGTPEFEELGKLSCMVQDYESKYCKICEPEPKELLEYCINEMNLTRSEMEEIVGDKELVANYFKKL